MSSVKIRRLYITSVIMLTLFSITFLIIPVANYVPIEYTKKVLVAIGALFWITGISGYSILIYVYRIERKKIGRKRERKIFLFSNVITTIADTCFVIGIITFVILVNRKLTTFYIIYVNIFIIVLAFNGHWLFSRKRYIQTKSRRKTK